MPSPFPGMDPYIEVTGVWPDFHGAYLGECRTMLNARLPAGYVATMEERVRLVSVAEEQEWAGRPDLAVARNPSRQGGPPRPPVAGGVAVAGLAPTDIVLPADYIEAREGYIQIIGVPDRDLVTTVEVLSPANKHEPFRGEYLSKRRTLLRGGVHVVEIDLLLRGRRPEPEDDLPPADYYALVTRAGRPPACRAYAWGVRRELPTIPVPLRPADGEVTIELAAAFARTYDNGRYDQLLRYDADLPQSLAPADRAWAADVARSAH